MLHAMLGGGPRIGRAVRRFAAVTLALMCAVVLSALVLPTKAEAKRLNVKFEIDNIDEHPEMRNKDFTYVCSFYHWDDYAQGGWRLSVLDGEWQWLDLDWAFGKNRAVSGPNDKDYTHIYWNNLTFRHGQTQTLNAGDRSIFYFYPSIGKHFARTDSGLSLKGIEYTAGTWSINYNDKGYGPRTLTPFNFGGFTGTGDGSITLHLRYDRGLPAPKPIVPNLKLEPSKQIDYLGDKVANSDTTRSGANDYRLYLTGKTVDNTVYNTYKSKNIILAVDVSLSMRYTFDGVDNGSWERFTSLKKAAGRLIDSLGASDPNNTFSVVSFSSDDKYAGGSGGAGTYVRAKTVSAASAKNTVNGLKAATSGGTDYFSAFRRIDDCCVGDKENIVLFLTDGEPTSVPKDVLRRDMGSTAQSVIAVAWTRYAAEHRLANVKGFYSVFIGTNTGSSSVLSMITRATNISDEDRASVQASSDAEMQALVDLLSKRLKKPSISVAMEDQLSDYVRYEGTPKVTATEEGGHTRVLAYGSDYTYEVNSNGRIRLMITKPATKNTTYVLSYDVSVKVDKALDYLTSNSMTYPNTGDLNTDYPITHNATSSGKAGFFSNDWAKGKITYDIGEGLKSVDYDFPKPVVQVNYSDRSKGKIGGRVTLFHEELTPLKFTFQLLDKNKNEIKFYDTDGNQIDIRNEKKDITGSVGDFNFPDIDYASTGPGTYVYWMKQVVPGTLNAENINPGDNIKYDTGLIRVTQDVLAGPSDLLAMPPKYEYVNEATGEVKSAIAEDGKAHFYNTYGIQGTYQ